MSATLEQVNQYRMPCRHGFNCKMNKENKCKFYHQKLCKFGIGCKFNKENKCKFYHPKKCVHGSNCEMHKENKCKFAHEKVCKWCDKSPKHDSSQHKCSECGEIGHGRFFACFTCKNNNKTCDKLLTDLQYITNNYKDRKNKLIDDHHILRICPNSMILEKCLFCDKYGCGHTTHKNRRGYLSRECENKDEIIKEQKSKVDKILNEQLISANKDSPDLPNDIANIVSGFIPYHMCKICSHPISTDDTIVQTHEEACLAEHFRITEMENKKKQSKLVKSKVPDRQDPFYECENDFYNAVSDCDPDDNPHDDLYD